MNQFIPPDENGPQFATPVDSVHNQPPPVPVMPQGEDPYFPIFPHAARKKRSGLWLILGSLAVLAIAFTFTYISGIFPARPEVSLSEASLDFGKQTLGNDYQGKTISITNTGYGKLTISELRVGDEDNFTIENDQCMGQSLGRGESCSFIVKFSPQAKGSIDNKVIVITNTKTSPNTIALSGKAIKPPCSVAILGFVEQPWLNDVVGKIEGTGYFDSVTSFNMMGGAIPSLSTLQQYSAILMFSEDHFFQPSRSYKVLDQYLVDYIHHGGGVVVAPFNFDLSFIVAVEGQLFGGGYLPMTSGDSKSGKEMTLVADIPASPILKGVHSFKGGDSSYHNGVQLAEGATLVAHWDDGTPLVAYLEFGEARVVGLNFFPVSGDISPEFWDTKTDGTLLMANALAWAGHCYNGK